ncbi:ATP-binding protein [Phenylobacterium sp.]|uniref:AAA family ATPase n=1 Tax=Phenylobacterium sp. TaxID=1871053 RepID=UPI0025DD4B84|nr:ATP-binding protein [Phenylobacterium sp.]MBX3483086.1 ATP-binding protein [Phenylobacterium sp.]
MDDVIVDGKDAVGTRRLSVQVKRSFRVSAAKTNADFFDVVARAQATLDLPEFQEGRDRIGVAAETFLGDTVRQAKAVCDWARDSATPEDFLERIKLQRFAAEAKRGVLVAVRKALGAALGAPATDAQVHRFFRHFVLLRFDLLGEAPQDADLVLDRIRTSLRPSAADQAPAVWDRLRLVAREAAGNAGSFDLAALRARLDDVASLAVSRSVAADVARLETESWAALSSINHSVDGFTVPRDDRVDELFARLGSRRFLQILGQPGVGKSAILRAVAERAAGTGPILVLKADRLVTGGWPAFAQRHRLESAKPRELLAQMAALGEPILFIDGLDRISRDERAVLSELLTPILEDPLLSDWRIVATARDGATEHLRQWLPRQLIGADGFETLRVEPLSGAECQVLVKAKPGLQPLLYGAPAVREIARRPFFLAVLARLAAVPNAPPPASETELLSVWWRGGGYDAEGADRGRRQECLLELAARGAGSLGRGMPIRRLDHDAIEPLRSDGVLNDAESGHTVSFHHDIFFEWAFTHLLIDAGPNWRDRLTEASEPPALGRPVELLSQLRFERDQAWSDELTALEGAATRSQWIRAWLLGPLSSPRFEEFSDQFSDAVRPNANDRLEKLLTWFQAVRTDAHPGILSSGTVALTDSLDRMRLADALGIPADIAAWRRLLAWLLSAPDAIPPPLWPAAVTLMEVWQRTAGGFDNPISRALLAQANTWLITLEDTLHPEEWRTLREIDGLDREQTEALETQLRTLLLRGSQVYPEIAEAYLRHLAERPAVNARVWSELAYVSDALAAAAPAIFIDALLAAALDPLPKENVARAERDYQERMKAADEAQDEREAELLRPVIYHPGVNRWDWDQLSLDRLGQAFYPPTPDTEPFRSLFARAPADGLRLVKTLANHAVAAWRELNEVDYERRATPIPLKLQFPWGEETYWGTWREYVAFRACFAPHILEAGLMAMEDWAFQQLEGGRDLDAIIEDLAKGAHHPAVLGICVALFATKPAYTRTTRALATAQRLWDWDLVRFIKMDQGPCANLIGAMGREEYVASLRRANERPARKVLLRNAALGFLFDPELRDEFSAAVAAFAENPPFEFEEQKQDPETVEQLKRDARHRAAAGDPANYTTQPVEQGVEVRFVNPHAEEPEAQAAVAQHDAMSRWLRLASWTRAKLESDGDAKSLTIEQAIAEAQALDEENLFRRVFATGDLTEIRRAGVVGAAAAVLLEPEAQAVHFEWAESVVFRALETPEPQDGPTIPESAVLFHPLLYAPLGLAALVRAGAASADDARSMLLQLIYHPLYEVSVRATRAICSLAATEPRLVWSAAVLVVDLSIRADTRRAYFRDREGTHKALWEAREASVRAALDAHFGGAEPSPPAIPMPVEPPPPARGRGFDLGDDEPDDEPQRRLDVEFLRRQLTELRPAVLREVGRQVEMRALGFDLLKWTIEKHRPDKRGRRGRNATALWEWRSTLMAWLFEATADLDAAEVVRLVIEPICELPDEPALAYLRDYANVLVCRDLYDSPNVAERTLGILRRIAERVADQARSWRDDILDDGLTIVRLLFGTAISGASGATRFANGDYRDLPLILPFVETIMSRLLGRTAVVRAWLTLVERAIDHYPAEAFARQAKVVLSDKDYGRALRAVGASARFSNIIQAIAEREALPQHVADVFLRLLDTLIDHGDRRAAALQRGELFRRMPRQILAMA